MGLVRRQAKHETVAATRVAVDATLWWDFKPGQRVMTVDGYPGTVTSVLDGPHAGNEAYEVVLDAGMGGGLYTSSQLRVETATTASVEHTAAEDYPELGTILVDRPDIAKNTVLASKTAAETWAGTDEEDGKWQPGNEHDFAKMTACPNCGTERALVSETGAKSCQSCGYHGGSKEAAFDPYSMVVEAATDPEFRFHITAAWTDVRNKAKRLRAEGKVRLTSVHGMMISAEVKGDHHVYETQVQHSPGNYSAVAMWYCGCKWGAYSWGRSGKWKQYEGRMCSHALATQYEAMSRGAYGRPVEDDQKNPAWLKARTRVVTEYDRDNGKNVSRPAVPRKRDLNRKYRAASALVPSISPVAYLMRTASANGDDPAEIALLMRTAGVVVAHDDDDDDKRKKKRKRHSHPHGNGYGAPWHGWGWAVGLCSQCDGSGCGHCSGTGQAKSNDPDPSDVSDDLGSEGGDAGDSGGDMGGGGDGGGTMASLAAAKTATPDEAQDEDWTPEQRDAWESGVTAAANDIFDEGADPDVLDGEAPQVKSRPLHRMSPMDNPGSTGWASGADPQNWGHTSPFGRVGAADDYDEAMFESDIEKEALLPALAPILRAVAPMVLDKVLDGDDDPEGVEAALNEEPEPALPQTDGEDEQHTAARDDTERDLLLAQSEDQIVAAFQRQATHLQGSGAAQASSDIARAAREHLAKVSMKEFSPAEQAAIINEGTGITASNLDRLDIGGTHYEALEAALAMADEDDEGWLG